jgi:uncharacterized protein
MPAWLHPVAGGCELRIKVVPGASRSGLAGILGDRVKVRVSAPPEGGKANQAVEELFSRMSGCPCVVLAGHSSPLKTILVRGEDPEALKQMLSG